MAEETILQHWVVTNFVLPFLLVFFIAFAILEKSKLLGEDKKQLNALVAFVLGLIFVGAVFPKLVVSNLILFLTVAIIVVFIGLLLWGFLTGGEAKISGKAVKIVGGIVVVLAVVVALLWATGTISTVFGWLFNQNWSATFWTNLIFIVVIAAAVAAVIGKKAS
jgi:hypothetical protein